MIKTNKYNYEDEMLRHGGQFVPIVFTIALLQSNATYKVRRVVSGKLSSNYIIVCFVDWTM